LANSKSFPLDISSARYHSIYIPNLLGFGERRSEPSTRGLERDFFKGEPKEEDAFDSSWRRGLGRDITTGIGFYYIIVELKRIATSGLGRMKTWKMLLVCRCWDGARRLPLNAAASIAKSQPVGTAVVIAPGPRLAKFSA
jgi:hypothetical protein